MRGARLTTLPAVALALGLGLSIKASEGRRRASAQQLGRVACVAAAVSAGAPVEVSRAAHRHTSRATMRTGTGTNRRVGPHTGHTSSMLWLYFHLQNMTHLKGAAWASMPTPLPTHPPTLGR